MLLKSKKYIFIFLALALLFIFAGRLIPGRDLPIINSSHNSIDKRGQMLENRPLSEESIEKLIKKDNNSTQDNNLRLVGTMLPLKAIIEEASSGTQGIFKRGDSVFNRGTLIDIKSSSVRISINGTIYTYRVTSGDNPGESYLAINNDEATKIAREERYSLLIKDNPNSLAVRTGPSEWRINEDILEKAAENPAGIISNMRVSTYSGKDGQNGFKVSKIKPSGIFSKVGLKNGDVLLSINDFNVTSKLNWPWFMDLVKSRKEINLEVLRAGKSKSLTYKFN